jgi:hypothetical protein
MIAQTKNQALHGHVFPLSPGWLEIEQQHGAEKSRDGSPDHAFIIITVKRPVLGHENLTVSDLGHPIPLTDCRTWTKILPQFHTCLNRRWAVALFDQSKIFLASSLAFLLLPLFLDLLALVLLLIRRLSSSNSLSCSSVSGSYPLACRSSGRDSRSFNAPGLSKSCLPTRPLLMRGTMIGLFGFLALASTVLVQLVWLPDLVDGSLNID